MRRITTIFIHCSATPNGVPVSVEAIRREHKMVRGWKDIGYHWVVGVDGSRSMGRHIEAMGAGVAGFNAESIHICLVGGMDGHKARMKASLGAWSELAILCRELQTMFPKAKIKGHRDASPDLDCDGVIEPNEFIKECPAFEVSEWLKAGMQPNKSQVILEEKKA